MPKFLPPMTPEERAELLERIELGEVFAHYSRCLICQRRTPHEVCQAHANAEEWPEDLDSIWGSGEDLPIETCDIEGCEDCR